jgi:hypothetical protein
MDDIVAQIVSAFSTAFIGTVPFFTGVFFFVWVLTIPIWILKKL